MTRVFLQMFRKELELVEHGGCIHIQERTGQAVWILNGTQCVLSVISLMYRYVQDNNRTTRLDQGIYS